MVVFIAKYSRPFCSGTNRTLQAIGIRNSDCPFLSVLTDSFNHLRSIEKSYCFVFACLRFRAVHVVLHIVLPLIFSS